MQKVVDDDNESTETVYDESQAQLIDNSDYGDVPPLIEDSQIQVVPDPTGSNEVSKNSESSSHVSNTVDKGSSDDVSAPGKKQDVSVDGELNKPSGEVVSDSVSGKGKDQDINDKVARDIDTLAGRLWSDIADEEKNEEEKFSPIFTKSQKKKQNKAKIGQV